MPRHFTRRLVILIAICLMAAPLAPAGARQAPERAQSASVETYTVSFKKLCSAFRIPNRLYPITCRGGSAASRGGRLTAYQARLASSGDLVMRSRNTSCTSMKLKFWSNDRVEDTRLRVLTPAGRFTGTSNDKRIRTVRVRITRGAFDLSVGDSVDFQDGTAFITGRATCTTPTGVL